MLARIAYSAFLNFCMFSYFAYFSTYTDGKAKANRQELRAVADL